MFINFSYQKKMARTKGRKKGESMTGTWDTHTSTKRAWTLQVRNLFFYLCYSARNHFDIEFSSDAYHPFTEKLVSTSRSKFSVLLDPEPVPISSNMNLPQC